MGNRDIGYLKYRGEVLERYHCKCANCGCEDDLQIHHIVPLSIGGRDVITNLVPLCDNCHKAAHTGRNMTEYKRKKGTLRGGRKPQIDFQKFDTIFQKYIDGKIGRKVFCKLVGYNYCINPKNNPNLSRSMESRNIVEIKNNIDLIGVKDTLHEGRVVGYIVYSDGTKKMIMYHDTGENTVEYKKCGSGVGAGHCVQYIEPEKKPHKRSSKKA